MQFKNVNSNLIQIRELKGLVHIYYWGQSVEICLFKSEFQLNGLDGVILKYSQLKNLPF